MTNTIWNSAETITITTDDLDESGMIVNTTDIDIDHYYGHTIDISSITTDTIEGKVYDDLTINLDDILYEPKEFVDHMPSVDQTEAMCKEYPALEKAYENFKTIYNMVKQDYLGKQKDEELPF